MLGLRSGDTQRVRSRFAVAFELVLELALELALELGLELSEVLEFWVVHQIQKWVPLLQTQRFHRDLASIPVKLDSKSRLPCKE